MYKLLLMLILASYPQQAIAANVPKAFLEAAERYGLNAIKLFREAKALGASQATRGRLIKDGKAALSALDAELAKAERARAIEEVRKPLEHTRDVIEATEWANLVKRITDIKTEAIEAAHEDCDCRFCTWDEGLQTCLLGRRDDDPQRPAE